MIAIGLPEDRNAVRSNRWSSTGIGGARSITTRSDHSSSQIAAIQRRPGCSAARIGILRITRRPVAWCGATTIVTSRALKSP